MNVSLTVIRYPKYSVPFAVLAMALHRIPLGFNKKISFYKLMGSGKNGTFDKNPDWQQWAILTASKEPPTSEIDNTSVLIKKLYGNFISRWFSFFNCETWTIFLDPIEGHGKWDSQEPFGKLAKQTDYDGMICILTRATIRLSKLSSFWKNVDGVARQMVSAKGFITSLGIGEVPFIKQATFSIWDNRESMKQFAYQMADHKSVIQKTRKENWYSEDMFVRFRPIRAIGTIKGKNPLEGML